MAFVYEELSEEDKAFFASFGFRDPVFNSKLVKADNKCVVDREQCIYLVYLGRLSYGISRMEGPEPHYFSLIWKNHVIEIEVYFAGTGDYTQGVHSSIAIKRIAVPKQLRPEIPSIIDMLKAALTAYEHGTSRNLVSLVFTEIAAPIYV